MPDEIETPAAPAPAAPAKAENAERVIVLTAWTPIGGSQMPRGKVLRLPEDDAQALIAAKRARDATEAERRIAGID